MDEVTEGKARPPRRWAAELLATGLACGFLIVAAGVSCAKQDGAAAPAEYQRGETLFKSHCAKCHGEQAVGTDHGPPLVHKIYEPNHHADIAFQRAAANGVRAHHWKFGDMPKVEGVTPSDVDQIIGYVRWLQRQAGIN